MHTHLKYIDLSLSRMRDVCHKLDNIQNKIPNIIHIAGTNGKGSTLSFIRSILEHNGYSVNTFTSPHLVNYNERFYILGKHITNELLNEYTTYLNSIEGFQNLSVFEATTIIGFLAFFNNMADFTILETGLGGRLDATNIIKNPILNIITKLDFDHMNFLGDTIEKITYEKAGIIKNNAILLSDYQNNASYKILKKISAQTNNKFIYGGINYSVDEETSTLNYNHNQYDLSTLSLVGKHQMYNASLAIVSTLNIGNISLSKEKIIQGISNTKWLGRLQLVSNLYNVDIPNSKIYLDGAHNPSGSFVLNNFILEQQQQNPNLNIHIIISMLSKKDIKNTLSNFTAENIIFYPLQLESNTAGNHNYDFYNIADITNILTSLDHKTTTKADIKAILLHIKDTFSHENNLIIICGSLYLLGHILSQNPRVYSEYLQ